MPAVDCAGYRNRRAVFVGAARNIGIAETAAPSSVFSRTTAWPARGWAEARIRRHLAGAATVSSAVANSHPRNAIAARRPSRPVRAPTSRPSAELALRYGVSFDRRLFEEYGLFDESMRVAEDTEFLKRLPRELEPVWEPEVRTIHRNETRLHGLLLDQYRRGYRSGAYYVGVSPARPFDLPAPLSGTAGRSESWPGWDCPDRNWPAPDVRCPSSRWPCWPSPWPLFRRPLSPEKNAATSG